MLEVENLQVILSRMNSQSTDQNRRKMPKQGVFRRFSRFYHLLQGESDGLPVEPFQNVEESSEAFSLILFMGT